MRRRVRDISEVYRQRSISHAARNLGLTQPAVSQHIATLEAAIGHPLFDRQIKGVTPTPAADDLAADIGDRLDLAETALARARARSADLVGAIRIVGHGDFLSDVVAPRLVPLLREGIRVRLQTGDRDSVPHMLIAGEADLGITAFPTADRRLRTAPVLTERVMAVAAPQVAARINAAPDLAAALAAEPVVAFNHERPLIDEWLAHHGLVLPPVNPALLGQDLRALRRLLREGFGWSVLPAYLLARRLALGELAEIHSPHGHQLHSYHLAWAPAALRQPRVAHARQMLLDGLVQPLTPETP